MWYQIVVVIRVHKKVLWTYQGESNENIPSHVRGIEERYKEYILWGLSQCPQRAIQCKSSKAKSAATLLWAKDQQWRSPTIPFQVASRCIPSMWARRMKKGELPKTAFGQLGSKLVTLPMLMPASTLMCCSLSSKGCTTACKQSMN